MAKTLEQIFRPKIPTLTGIKISDYIPDFIKKPVQEFFAPTPEVRTRDVLREIPNTIAGVGKGIKEAFIPSRGFTEKEILEAQPDVTFKQRIESIPKLGAELLVGTISLGELLRDITSFAPKKVEIKPFATTKAGQALLAYSQPKTVEEAAALRVTDIATFFVGNIKIG